MKNGLAYSSSVIFGDTGPVQQIDPVIHCICESMHTDKIFLLGTYQVFPKSLGPEYDLLVLIDSGYKKPVHEFESIITNRCHDFAMVTASVHRTDVVAGLLNQGNIFFSNLCRTGKLIFDGGAELFVKDRPVKVNPDIENLESDFSCLFSKAKSFFSGAIGYRIAGDNQLAAFMLHQTVEHGLNAFLIPLMGYRLQTHNLNKLFLYARRISQKFYTVFPRNTDPEIKLYQTLHKAYIYGRYKNNFEIGRDALQILIDRSTELLEMIQIIFYEKIEELRNESKEIVKQ